MYVTMNLSELRKEIDKIDSEIIELLHERLSISVQIAEYKSKNNLPVLDKKREDEIINDRVSKFNSTNHADSKFISSLFKTILDKSKEIQENKIKDGN